MHDHAANAEEILDREYPVLDHGFVRLVDYLGNVVSKMPGSSAADREDGDYLSYVDSQYDVVAGRMPQSANEAVAYPQRDNRIAPSPPPLQAPIASDYFSAKTKGWHEPLRAPLGLPKEAFADP